MKQTLSLTVFLALLSLTVFGQEDRVRLDVQESQGSAIKSRQFTLECLGEINTPSTDLKWRPILNTVCIAREPKMPDYEMIKKIKEAKTEVKEKMKGNIPGSEISPRTVTPVVGSNWLGNLNNGGSPLDNSIAVSDGGIVVSVANTTIEIDDPNGNTLYYNNLPTFFNDPGITNTCDPVALYDRQADRFIVFFQECAGNSANSFLCIAFSKTNNPATGGWWKYKLTGNPLNNNCWFDYPKLAVSNNELYITGNLFTNSDVFNQAILYQIQKANGYNGLSLNWQYWSNIPGSPATLLPVGNGHGQAFGPGCYLVSTISAGGSTIKLYDLTDDLTATNEQLNYYPVSTTTYAPAGNAFQLGTNCELDNGDCRALSGFYLNGIIHFVFHSDIGSGWNGINYNRLTLSPLANQSSTYGLSGSFDYSYPSVASYATTTSDKSVMIGFGRSGSSIRPEVRVVNCDNSMNWSNSTLVKASSAYVCYTSTTEERWGDYTGATRKHNSTRPTIWMSGMFGNSSNKWETWIAEIKDNTVTATTEVPSVGSLRIFPNPVIEVCTIEFNLLRTANLYINIYDAAGKLVKDLYSGRASTGLNIFSFNKANLSSGTYFLVIREGTKIIKNEKIVVAR